MLKTQKVKVEPILKPSNSCAKQANKQTKE